MNLSVENEIQYIRAIHNLTAFFQNDYKKIQAFMYFENLNLGGISPWQMIQLGRGNKLNKWIETTLDENKDLK